LNRDQVLRINVESEEHIHLLKELEDDQRWELDFWTHPVSTELPIDIHVPYSSLHVTKDFLQDNKIPFSVMINNLQDLLDEEQEDLQINNIKECNAKSFDFGAYHTLEAIYSWMDTLVSDYPNLVSKMLIGTSYENRPMYVLKFSTGGTKRPAIWVDAGIHSREWVSSASTVWMANKMATDYGVDSSVTSLLDQMDVYLMIVNNPDGYVYTHTNVSSFSIVCLSDFHIYLLGPNVAQDSSSPMSYHGPHAHSEIEVKNVVDLVRSHGNFKAFISIHAYSQLLMYPYGYVCTSIPHQAELVSLSAVQALSSLYGTSYKVGSICKIIYQASGGSIDWSYDIGIKYSFAFELRDTGRYGFLLPASQIIPTASETWLGLKYIMEYVRDHPY
uniref:Peptidase M14 domain-containing protein n=1 Tax=Electrophorus electricus TaxID=8005 RepID=A0AAY5F5F9_ELEEL